MEKKTNDQIKPKGFYVNLEWDESILDLDNVEAGQLFKNMFNYLLERELIETSKTVTVMSKMAVFPTLNFNVAKYQKTVERNRENGKKGGRKGLLSDTEKPNQTQKNPVGYSGNPEEAKDRVKEKDIDKEREIVKENDKPKLRPNESIKESENETLKKFKKLVELDITRIIDREDKNYIIMAKTLVNELGWDNFFQIILGNDRKEATQLFLSLNLPDLEPMALEVRKHHLFFLNKLVK